MAEDVAAEAGEKGLRVPWRGWAVFAGLYFAVLGLVTAWRGVDLRRHLVMDADSALRTGIALARATVPEEYLERAQQPGVVGEQEYVFLRGRLNAAVAATPLEYLYTMAVRDGRLHFTASSETQEDMDEGTETHYWDDYPEAPAGLAEASEGLREVTVEYEDRWGRFRSLFVPARLAGGATVVYAADYSMDALLVSVASQAFTDFTAGLLISLSILPGFVWALRGQRRFIGRLVEETARRRKAEARLLQVERVEALGQLAGGMAHDFNNVLTGVLGQARLLEKEAGLPERVRAGLGLIAKAAERGADLTRRVLDSVRLDEARSARVNVHEVAAETVEMLERTLGAAVRIERRFEAGNAWVRGDASRIGHALMNLGINARDAMEGRGTLRIRTENVRVEDAGLFPKGAGVAVGDMAMKVVVEDSGHGIPAAALGRLFEPFFTTKAFGKGTGLGLSSVFGTMRSHRGVVLAENRAEGGARFTLLFPQRDGGAGVAA